MGHLFSRFEIMIQEMVFGESARFFQDKTHRGLDFVFV